MANKCSGFDVLSEWKNKLDDFNDSIDQNYFRENPQLYLSLIKEGFKSKETISNARFDQILDQRVRRASSVHWTSVEVILSILELLDLDENSKVLDVGSGCGKFCLVGALNSRAHFTGIE